MLESVNYNKILVVIVLYKCHLCDSKAFNSAIEASKKAYISPVFYVFDNTPGNIQLFECKNVNGYKVESFISDVNVGVSGAYNQAYNYSVKNNLDWLVLLDQDTSVSDNYFIEFLKVKNESASMIFAPVLKDITSSKILSPCKYRFGRASHFKSVIYGENKLYNTSFLNSGLIISTKMFQLAGGYNEKLPMYFSDFNFIDRCRNHIDSYYLLETTFEHSMSSNDKSSIDAFLPRFRMYIEGAMECYDSYWMKFIMNIWVLLRAVKSSIQLRSLKPIILFVKILFHA